MTLLAHSTGNVLSSPTTVFLTLLPAKQDWTHPPAVKAYRFEPEISEFIHVVMTAIQHFHGIGSSLASSGTASFLRNHRETVQKVDEHFSTLLFCPSEQFLSSLRWSLPNSFTYACHNFSTLPVDRPLGRYRPLRWYALRSFCLYWLYPPDVFKFADYILHENLTLIFTPLS